MDYWLFSRERGIEVEERKFKEFLKTGEIKESDISDISISELLDVIKFQSNIAYNKEVNINEEILAKVEKLENILVEKVKELDVVYIPIIEETGYQIMSEKATFIFTSRKLGSIAIRKFNENCNLNIYLYKVLKKDLIACFKTLVLSGVEEIIIDNYVDTCSLKIDSFKPFYYKESEKTNAIMNPKLQRALIAYTKAEVEYDSGNLASMNKLTEAYSDVINNLANAKFLLPFSINENGEYIPTVVKNPNIKGYMIALFTDWMEFGKFEDTDNWKGIVVTLNDILKTLSTTEGVVINCGSSSFIMDKELIGVIKSQHFKKDKNTDGNIISDNDISTVNYRNSKKPLN